MGERWPREMEKIPLGGPEGEWVEVYAGRYPDLAPTVEVLEHHGCDPLVFNEGGDDAFPLGLGSTALGRIGVPPEHAQRARDVLREWGRERDGRRSKSARTFWKALGGIFALPAAVAVVLLVFCRGRFGAFWGLIPAALIASITLYVLIFRSRKTGRQ